VSTRRTRRRGKKKHRGNSAIRADTRHCALARYRLAPVLHERTRGSLLERLVAKLRGRAPSLSRIMSLRVALPSARAPRTPSSSTPIAPFPFLSPTPDTHSSCPPLYLSIRISFLPMRLVLYPPRLSFFLLRRAHHSLSLSKTLPTPSIKNFHPFSLSLSLFLAPLSPQEEICRADSFSSRKSRHLRSRSCAPYGNAISF